MEVDDLLWQPLKGCFEVKTNNHSNTRSVSSEDKWSFFQLLENVRQFIPFLNI